MWLISKNIILNISRADTVCIENDKLVFRYGHESYHIAITGNQTAIDALKELWIFIKRNEETLDT